jgi:deoxyribonuclease (pyrimidine dimer)
MTRINLVHPSELHQKHLVAEYREIVRVFSLARAAQDEMHKKKVPSEYTLGNGHVLFFYDKLKFISDRYDSICNEMISRGYKINRIDRADLHRGINKNMFFDYLPTEKGIKINRERILERMPKSRV